MLQRYDLDRNDRANRFSIKEYAVLETKSRKRHDYRPTGQDYALIHEVSYDSDNIRAAIKDGQKALIALIRTGDFFPIYPCVKIIAKGIVKLFNGQSDPAFELFFDDRTLLFTYEEEKDTG